MLDNFDFRHWRECYLWPPTSPSRQCSEQRIIDLEARVEKNILSRGTQTCKEIFLDIRRWKTGYRKETYFMGNSDRIIQGKVRQVSETLEQDPDAVDTTLRLLKMPGVAISIASAFLRFLDPINHRFGIIDRFVACFCNKRGLTNFRLRAQDSYLLDLPHNYEEYRRYHSVLHQMAVELRARDIEFMNIHGKMAKFDPVDVEMAFFAFSRQEL